MLSPARDYEVMSPLTNSSDRMVCIVAAALLFFGGMCAGSAGTIAYLLFEFR